MGKPLNFKGRIVVVNGKDTLVVDPIAEVIPHTDGVGQDVIMHMPSLSMINDCKLANGIQ